MQITKDISQMFQYEQTLYFRNKSCNNNVKNFLGISGLCIKKVHFDFMLTLMFISSLIVHELSTDFPTFQCFVYMNVLILVCIHIHISKTGASVLSEADSICVNPTAKRLVHFHGKLLF